MSRWREPGAAHPMCRMEAIDVALEVLNDASNASAGADRPWAASDLSEPQDVYDWLVVVRRSRGEDLVAGGWHETEDTERNGALARALTVLLL